MAGGLREAWLDLIKMEVRGERKVCIIYLSSLAICVCVTFSRCVATLPRTFGIFFSVLKRSFRNRL
jgi:hypothetical protein